MSKRRRHRTHKPIPAVRRSSPQGSGAPGARGGKPAGQWILLTFGLVALGLAAWWWSSRGSPPKAREVEPSRSLAPANAPKDQALRGAVPVHSNLISLLDSPLPSTNRSKSDKAIVLNQTANKLMDAGDPAGAISLYEKALVLAPEDEDLHYNLGIAYAKVGDFPHAEAQYREALRLLPDYAEVHNNLGNLLLRMGRLEEAAQELNEAINLQPQYAAAQNNLGIVRQKQKRLEDAAACFRKALEFDTNYLEAHFNLAGTYMLAGKPDQAIPEYREVLRIDPGFEPAQKGLARAGQN